uniref:Uncharacterized protein n=1 Tax=Ciona intestinalis TaxID=7719 RepID=H2XW80_CIOIN
MQTPCVLHYVNNVHKLELKSLLRACVGYHRSSMLCPVEWSIHYYTQNHWKHLKL